MSFITPTFRDLIRRVCPPWLQNGEAEKLLFAIAVQIDALGDAVTYAIAARFPGVYTMSSLATIGRERRIRRGALETDTAYAERLRRWLYDHQRRGGPYALLGQLHANFGADRDWPIVLQYRSGARYTLAPDGTVTRTVVPSANDPQWATWSLFYVTDKYTAADLPDLAIIPREWIAAHCFGSVKLLVTGGELWDYPNEYKWNQSGTWNTAPVASIGI